MADDRLSKAAIDRLGERLRSEPVPSAETLEGLRRLRAEYQAILDQMAAELYEVTGLEPTTRVKTTGTLVDKLRRSPSMRLSQVDDIAGARLVLDGDRLDQDELVANLVRRFPGATVNDRRVRPSSGYRAMHVVVPSGGRIVEIQVRTFWQHLWADAFEKLADDWGRQIRYGGLPDDPDSIVGAAAEGLTRAEAVAAAQEASELFNHQELLALERRQLLDQPSEIRDGERLRVIEDEIREFERTVLVLSLLGLVVALIRGLGRGRPE